MIVKASVGDQGGIEHQQAPGRNPSKRVACPLVEGGCAPAHGQFIGL